MIYGGRVIAFNMEIAKDSMRYKAMTTKLDETKAREDERKRSIRPPVVDLSSTPAEQEEWRG